MSNPFTRQSISNNNTKNYSVEDVKKSKKYLLDIYLDLKLFYK